MFSQQDSRQFTKKMGLSILISAIFFIQPLQPLHAQRIDSGDIIDYQQAHHPEMGYRGMVTTQNKVATQVGVDILKKGGNAVDAAVAVGFALAVTLPRAGNLGGGGVMLVHHAPTHQTLAFDYYGQAPAKITRNLLVEAPDQIGKKIFSHQAVATPGTVAGLWEAHRRFGKLPWKMLVEPAIQLAHKGFRLSFDEAQALRRRQSILARDTHTAKVFFKPNGHTYTSGEYFKQPDLAWSLTEIQKHGKNAFYKGTLAQRFIQGIQQQGGILTLKDLAQYTVKISSPIWSTYRRNYKIASAPSPASGIVLASIMNIVEQFPMRQLGANTAESIHILAEAFKLSRDDVRYIGNHPQWRAPTIALLHKLYAIKRAKWIHPKRTLTHQKIESVQPTIQESADTTHYTVADATGNVVSNTYTLSDSFGAHVIAPGTGILLNNTLKNLAWLASSDTIRKKSRTPTPYQRIPSAITPVIVFKHNQPWLATGSLGGGRIPGVIAQLLINIIDHQLNVAEATMRPRIGQYDVGEPLVLESSISDDMLPLLKAKGHRIKRTKVMGSAQSIVIENGVFQGAADTRRPNALAMAAD